MKLNNWFLLAYVYNPNKQKRKLKCNAFLSEIVKGSKYGRFMQVANTYVNATCHVHTVPSGILFKTEEFSN